MFRSSTKRTFAICLTVAGAALTIGAIAGWKRLANARVEFYAVEDLEFSPLEQLIIPWRVSGYIAEVRDYLPTLPTPVLIRVQAAGLDQVNENGDEAYFGLPDTIIWAVDVKRQGGALRLARTELRARMFHELYHLAREIHVADGGTMAERMISEGLATAFERDYGQVSKPWSWYPANVGPWVDELIAAPPDSDIKTWMRRHPDGREWIAFKAGAYVVDQAFKSSGKTCLDLLTIPASEILALARRSPIKPQPSPARVYTPQSDTSAAGR